MPLVLARCVPAPESTGARPFPSALTRVPDPLAVQASFDKQYVRNYLKESNFDKKTPVVLPAEVIQATKDKYVKIFQILTGADPVL